MLSFLLEVFDKSGYSIIFILIVLYSPVFMAIAFHYRKKDAIKLEMEETKGRNIFINKQCEGLKQQNENLTYEKQQLLHRAMEYQNKYKQILEFQSKYSLVETNNILKGKLGEYKVAYILKELDNSYYCFNDIKIMTGNNKYTQIDHIVVSDYCIFVIETKYYSRDIEGDINKSNWISKGLIEDKDFTSPIYQNKCHIEALKNELKLNENIIFYNLIVFAGDGNFQVPIYRKIGDNTNIIHITQLLGHIKKYNLKRISREEKEDIRFKLSKLKDENEILDLAYMAYETIQSTFPTTPTTTPTIKDKKA